MALNPKSLLIVGASLVAATLISAGTSWALPASNTATVTVTADVLAPITLTESGNLYFGRLVLPISGSGHVSLAANGTLSQVSGNFTVISGYPPTTPVFTVSATPTMNFSFTIDASTYTLDTGLVASAFSFTPGGTNGVTFVGSSSGTGGTFVMGSAGTGTIRLGADLVASSYVPSGVKSQTLTATVSYN